MESVRWVLKKLKVALRLWINFKKSSVVFSQNTLGVVCAELAQVLRVRVADKHVKYLGLPAMVGCSKREVFQNLKDRFWKKF
ncbi:UNVERIFIED_CONTAM: hypothetical protein Slati_3421100 [Sesamum latifolium]|uniref:Reverse transcriptase n=1 Tax=Sesamum latifolium TaxID=2727402 RepID=A0AAW2UHQ3_9LAMI